MMTPEDQERFFERVRVKYPNWSKQKVSGYVHGVTDESRHKEPSSDQVATYLRWVRCRIKRMPQYATGYLLGFVDAFGEDVTQFDWFRFLHIHRMEYRWWTDEP